MSQAREQIPPSAICRVKNGVATGLLRPLAALVKPEVRLPPHRHYVAPFEPWRTS
jgi:hypothetical protein